MRRLAPLLVFCLALPVGAVASAPPTVEPPFEADQSGPPRIDDPLDVPPSTSTICMYMFLAVASETGRRCAGSTDPIYHAALESEIERLGEHIRRTTGAPREALANLRRRQSGHDAPDDHVCSGFPLEVWQNFSGAGADRTRQMVDGLIARQRPVDEGDCL